MPDAEFKGMDTLVGILHNAKEQASPFVAQQAEDVMSDIFNESQRQCPVRTGVLRGSGHMENEDAGQGVTIAIGYGGAAAEYALFVHENLAAHHKPPTKAKFLEDPFNEKINELPKRVQEQFEATVLTQYPQSPSRAATAERQADVARANVGSLAKRRGMTAAEIHSALKAATSQARSGTRRTWHRHRGR